MKSPTAIEFAVNEDLEIQTAISAAPAAEQTAVEAAQMVKVRALRTFHIGENMSGDLVHPNEGKKSEFTCHRHRAAQLRANGLVEYVDASDGVKNHGEDAHKAMDDKIQKQLESEKIPERHKTSALQNPVVVKARLPQEK